MTDDNGKTRPKDGNEAIRQVELPVERGEPVGMMRLDAPLFFGENQAGELAIDYSMGSDPASNRAVMLRLVLSVEAASTLLDALRGWETRRGARGEETPKPVSH